MQETKSLVLKIELIFDISSRFSNKTYTHVHKLNPGKDSGDDGRMAVQIITNIH